MCEAFYGSIVRACFGKLKKKKIADHTYLDRRGVKTVTNTIKHREAGENHGAIGIARSELCVRAYECVGLRVIAPLNINQQQQLLWKQVQVAHQAL